MGNDTQSSQVIAKARRFDILKAVGDAKTGQLSMSEIRKRFYSKTIEGNQISDVTLRKDIREILTLPRVIRDANEGGLTKVPEVPFGEGTYFWGNLESKPEEKEIIAREVLKRGLIKKVDTIAVGPGTTTLALLQLLGDSPGVTSLTTNLGVVMWPNLMTNTLHLSGGWCLPSIASLVGLAAEQTIRGFHARAAVIGVSGLWIDKEGEIQLGCHHEAQIGVKRALVDGCESVIVVTTGEKFGVRDAWDFSCASSILKQSNLYIVTDNVQSEKTADEFVVQLHSLRNKSKTNHEAELYQAKGEKGESALGDGE